MTKMERKHEFRTALLVDLGTEWDERETGEIYLRSRQPLKDSKTNICQFIEDWATKSPDHSFLAQRDSAGDWQHISYGDMWRNITAVGQALLNMGLNAETPVAILTPNSIEHAIISYAGMAAGIPVCAVSPAYSTLKETRGLLQTVLGNLKPKVVFAQDADKLAAIRDLPELEGCTWISAQPAADALQLSDLQSTDVEQSFHDAYAATGHDTVAKILFTSGSTGKPKGVVNTHGMLCKNMAAFDDCTLQDQDEFVIVDWMPWHHTMGGNFQLGATILHGGTMYIDGGKPVPALFSQSLDNLRAISPTLSIGVPAYFMQLAQALEQDEDLRRSFFARMRYVIHAGAKLQQSVVDRIQKVAIAETGTQIAMISAYGTTETAPGISINTRESSNAEDIGAPLPGVELKLLPHEGTYELRVRGPNVLPRYLNAPEATEAAFDEDGFYRTGDTVAIEQYEDGRRWLRIGGRLAENYKLSAGAWVMTGPLRGKLMQRLSPFVREICFAGQDQASIRIMLWLNEAACKAQFPELADADPETLATHPALQEVLAEGIRAHNAENPAVTQRIAAFMVDPQPLSIGAGEITDKGNINQRGTLKNRAAQVERLYETEVSGDTIVMTGAR